MRKIIILGALAALVGLAAVAQANDQPQSGMPDGTQVTGQAAHKAANGSRDAKHNREARNEHSRERHHESGEKRHQAREGHDEHEAAEHKDRR